MGVVFKHLKEKEKNKELPSISVFRNVDRARILFRSIDNCVNFDNFKNFEFYRGIILKRDMSIYKHKLSYLILY
jgi:hypothetical protein